MENRFSIKDMVVIALLVALLLSVWLAMNEFDRQWRDVQQIKNEIRNLTTEQAQTRNEVGAARTVIDQGVRVSGSAPSTTTDAENDPFTALRAARAQKDFAQGDWLIDAFGTKVGSITALVYKDLYGRRIQDHVLEPLLGQDPNTLEEVPHIAESWRIEDHSEKWRAFVETATKKYGAQADADVSVLQKGIDLRLEQAAKQGDKPTPGSEAYKSLEAEAREAWIKQQIDADPDRPSALVITFKIRQGVVFSDGHPLTSEDVVFSYDLLMNEEIDAAGTRQFYDNIEKAEARGSHEVAFYMKEPHFLALGMAGGQPIIPKHFYEKYTPEQINRHPGLLMGSGPYRLKDPAGWKPGDLLELVRNERYWGPQAAFDRLVWKEVTNDVARLTMFTNGEVDYFNATPTQYAELLKNKDLVARTHQKAFKTVPSGYLWMAWQQMRNGKATMFTDKRVRQAMTYLTERQRICDEVYKG